MSDSEEIIAEGDNEFDSDAPVDVSDAGSDEEPEDVDVVDPDQDAPIGKYASVIRIVHLDDRKTSEVMSSLEQAEYVSIRAQQIATYNNCMVANNLHDPIEMAKLELMQRKCPLFIRRKVGEVREGDTFVEYYEEWDPNSMIFAIDYATT